MNEYVYEVLLRVKVEAFDERDARDAVDDCFGEGDFCGVEVVDHEITDFEVLT